MQNAECVLSNLNQKSQKNREYLFERIYRNLFNPNLYVRAYQKLYAKEGNMTEGVDGNTIDGFNMSIVEDLIAELKDERYYPKPVKRTYIPKKNGKMRPLGIPSFRDKLVQEVIRQQLEAIYEPIFFDCSHGFRPYRSCHTALHQVKTKCAGTSWVIEGDITGFFDNINHDVLLALLGKKIRDGRFIELIRRFLKAGYVEFHQLYSSLSGTPQGGIVSPILANIYLHELDKFMMNMCSNLSKGSRRKRNPEYIKINNDKNFALRKGNIEKACELLKKMRNTPSGDMMDKDFVRVKYTRYADDFVVCIIGDKNLATEIKGNISLFLKEQLKLELNQDKTLITNLASKRVRFLGYEISITYDNTAISKSSNGKKGRYINGSIQLLVPGDVIYSQIRRFTKLGKPIHYGRRVNMPVLDIISEYNSEIRGLYNYYKLATDVSTKLYKFKYYHEASLVKTIARKENISCKKVYKKYGVNVKRKQGTGTRRVIGVSYEVKGQTRQLTYFNDSIRLVKEPSCNVQDYLVTNMSKGKQLIQRLNSNKCELCGVESDNSADFFVHHVRKLKDIKDKYKKRGNKAPKWVLYMSKINRKTLIVCHDCHWDIHRGEV